MNDSAPTLQWDDRERGWRHITTLYSCVPDSIYPYDPEVLRAMQEIVPGVAPLWIRTVMLTPPEANGYREIKVFGRHGLGVLDPNCPEDVRINVDVMPYRFPHGVRFPRPNRVKWIFQYKPVYDDLPGRYFPFDWGAYAWVDEQFGGTDDPDADFARVMGKQARLERAAAARRAEQDYIWRDLNRFIERKREQVSELEERDYFLGSLPALQEEQ
jgi:hypothetical protein